MKNLYYERIFPHLIDKSLSGPQIMDLRIIALRPAQGEILEIGFGTGLNLNCYPATIDHISVVEDHPHLHHWSEKRADAAQIKVDYHQLSAERLPFPDATFDTVVSTWTMCSIPDVDQALTEIKRVLKPAGRFLFLEHGLSPDVEVVRWQKRLNPFYQCLGAGCHLDRNIEKLIIHCGLKIVNLTKFYLQNTPRFNGYVYHGMAENK